MVGTLPWGTGSSQWGEGAGLSAGPAGEKGTEVLWAEQACTQTSEALVQVLSCPEP